MTAVMVRRGGSRASATMSTRRRVVMLINPVNPLVNITNVKDNYRNQFRV
jgi:hypothetical protein